MKQNPSEEWLRIAAEARPQERPLIDEAAPAWFVTRALAQRRAARAAVSAPWFAIPGLARAAVVSATLAVACAVFVLSTGSLDVFTDPLAADPALEEFDLP